MNLTISAVRWPIALKPGEARQSQLDLAHEHSAEFTVAVPESAVLLRVKLKCRQADL